MEGNGFYFVTAAGPPGADPVRWYAEASADNGSSWAPVAASVMFLGRDGTPAFVAAAAPPPTERRLWQVGAGGCERPQPPPPASSYGVRSDRLF